MEIEVNDTKIYTNGDWVQVTVSIGPTCSNIQKVRAELRGILTTAVGLAQISVNLYVSKRVFKLPQSGLSCRTFQFAMQFPGHKKGLKIPPTMDEANTRLKTECQHIITVKAIEKKQPRSCGTQKSARLQFMPSEDARLLTNPGISCTEHCQKGLSILAVLATPTHFAQNGLGNIIAIRLLDPEFTGLRILDARVVLSWMRQLNRHPIYSAGSSEQIESWQIKPNVYDDDDKIKIILRLSGCNLPTHNSADLYCGYVLDIGLTLFNSNTQRCQSLVFSKPIQVLPTNLYKDKPGCPVTKQEIRELLSLKVKTVHFLHTLWV